MLRFLTAAVLAAFLSPANAEQLPTPFVASANIIATHQLTPTSAIVYRDTSGNGSVDTAETVHVAQTTAVVVAVDVSEPGYYHTEWLDAAGATWIVRTPRPTSGSTLARKRARREHLEDVEYMMLAHPVVPPPAPPQTSALVRAPSLLRLVA